MRWSHTQMYRRMLASDAACNGQFFTGVLTTGIYCLPSCGARKPRVENVRFFPTCEAARDFGLRPCKKCHPDDFARGADPVLEQMEVLVGEIRAQPERFAGVPAIVKRSGFSSSRLFELLRQHYHRTPADLLTEARVRKAERLLASSGAATEATASVAAVGYAVGFASVSVFHDQFRRLNGLTPAAYRGIHDATGFSLTLPPHYPLAHLRRALTRDPHSLTDRWQAQRYTTTSSVGDATYLLQLDLRDTTVDVGFELVAGRPVPMAAFALHRRVASLLGYDQDPAGFTRHAARLDLRRLTAGRAGLRVVQTLTPFDGLVWSIIGQQINFAFACLLRRRLVERVGQRLAADLWAPPTAATLATLPVEQLLPLQFSQRKVEYLIHSAKLVAGGELDLEQLREASATRAERTLLAIRGLGPWSVNYLMMRSLGFADCVPLGDTGVTSGLQMLFQLDRRPDADATRRLMRAFSPYRSLATAHLWQLRQPSL